MQHPAEATAAPQGLPPHAMHPSHALLHAVAPDTDTVALNTANTAAPAAAFSARNQQAYDQHQQHLTAATNQWHQSQGSGGGISSNGHTTPSQQQLQDWPYSSNSPAPPYYPAPLLSLQPRAMPHHIPASSAIQGNCSMPPQHQNVLMQTHVQQQAAAALDSSAPASSAAYPLSPSLHVQLLGSRTGSSSSNLGTLLPEVASPPSTPGSLAGTADVQQYWLQLQQQQLSAARASVSGASPGYKPSLLGMPAGHWHHPVSSSSSSQMQAGSSEGRNISSGSSSAQSAAASHPASNRSSAPGYQPVSGLQYPQLSQQHGSSAALSHASTEFLTPRSTLDGASGVSSSTSAGAPGAAPGSYAPANGTEELLRQVLMQMSGQQQQQQQQQTSPVTPGSQHMFGTHPPTSYGALSPQRQQQAAVHQLQLQQSPQQHVMHQQQNHEQQQPALDQLAQQLLAALAAGRRSDSATNHSSNSHSSIAATSAAAVGEGISAMGAAVVAGTGLSTPSMALQGPAALAGMAVATQSPYGGAVAGSAQYNSVPASNPASNHMMSVSSQQPLHPFQQQHQHRQQYQQIQPQQQQPQQHQHYQQQPQHHQHHQQQPQQQQHYLQQPQQHQHYQQQPHSLGALAPAAAAAAQLAHYGPQTGGNTAATGHYMQQDMWGQAPGMPFSSVTQQTRVQMYDRAVLDAQQQHSQPEQHSQQQQQQQQQQPGGESAASVDAQAAQQMMLPSPAVPAADVNSTTMVAADMMQQQQQQAQVQQAGNALAAAHHHSQHAAATAAAAAGGSQLAPGFFPASMLAHPAAHTAALGPYMAAAAMAAHQPTMLLPYYPGAAMMAPAAMQPEFLQAAAAQQQGMGMGLGMHMAYGMYPAVPVPMHMHMPVQMQQMPAAGAAAAAGMQYWQSLQRQMFEAAAAAAQGGNGASVSTVPPSEAGDMSRQSTVTPAAAADGAASPEATGLQVASAAAGGGDSVGSALQRMASTGMVAGTQAGWLAGMLPQEFAAAGAWPLSAAEAAMALLLGRGFWTAANAAQRSGQHGQQMSSTDGSKQVAVPGPAGRGGVGLHLISVPAAVLAGASNVAAAGLGLVTNSTAAAARLYVMALVWFAHYQLVLLLYTLLAASAAVLASQQLAWGTAKAAVTVSWQTGVFALRQGRLFAGAAARVVASDLKQLPQQVLLSHPLLAANQPLPLGGSSVTKLLLAAPAEATALNTTAGGGGREKQLESSSVGASWSTAAWARSALDLITGTSKPGTDQLVPPDATAEAADAASPGLVKGQPQQQQQQQQQVMACTASSTGLGDLGVATGQQQQQQQQGNSSSLAVADSLSVISGLWVGLGLKLWLLLGIQAPYTTGRIWLSAAGQGASMSIAAVQGAVAYALHAVQLLLQCSALLLTHSRLQLPAAGFTALAVAGRLASAATDLVMQLAGVWWKTVGGSMVAAGHELLQSAAETLPGGVVMMQLLGSAATSSVSAAQATAAALHSSWRFFAAANEEDWRGINVHSVAAQLLAWGAAGAGWVMLHALSAAELVAVAVTSRVLQGAHPMAEAAVWGSAGMLKRLVVEASQQSWLLLMQLYRAWQQQQ